MNRFLAALAALIAGLAVTAMAQAQEPLRVDVTRGNTLLHFCKFA